ncbi:MAG TPA: FAD:protein FMN transferase [Jatrophihabitans sp.]|jgi:thiamine biosynthesis lipoprotein|uniref:FAD:protein FMN transferase n=1 Tax=Jatrophihabitans sp. TaxID=1932789 RepID=UPI002F17E271
MTALLTEPLVRQFATMGTTARVRVERPGPDAERAVDAVQALFGEVQAQCTRFDPASPLMRANAAGSWHPVPQWCYAALEEAAAAHVRTGRLFDPRVLTELVELGYDTSLPFSAGPVSLPARQSQQSRQPQRPVRSVRVLPWQPRFDAAARAVAVGPAAVDLGGIAKGLAVRWAADLLRASADTFFVDAGGDGYFAGAGPADRGWSVGVEDPLGGTDPVAVLAVRDQACATSSTRLRRWQVGDRTAHHLIDPRTGGPSAGGLASVTVVGSDPAAAEVWSKALFLHGADQISSVATAEGIAALWVRDDGRIGATDDLAPALIWSRP